MMTDSKEYLFDSVDNQANMGVKFDPENIENTEFE